MIYSMYQGSIFWAHVDRFYCDASVLEDPLCAQQEPCARCIDAIQCGTVDLDIGRAAHIEAAQCGIEVAAPRVWSKTRPRPAEVCSS